MDPHFQDVLARLIASGASTDDLLLLCLGRLRTLARRMLAEHPELRRREDTDDLIQSAAIRLQRAFAAVVIESPEHAMALAVTQLKRELIDLVRRHRRGVEVEAELARRASTEDRTLQAWEDFHAVVDALPPEQRQAVHFLWYLGLSQPDAAKLLGVTDRTLRRWWADARATLRARLNEVDFGH